MISKWGYFKDFEKIFETLKIRIDDLKTERILITGATGLMGTAIVDMLMFIRSAGLADFEVVVAVRDVDAARVRFSEYVDSPDFYLVTYDLNSTILESDVGKCSFIIHAASIANPKWYTDYPVETIQTTFKGIENILGYAKRNQSRVVYVSSVEVYGTITSVNKVTESMFGLLDPMSVENSYAESKRVAEALCAAYYKQHGVEVIVARPAKIYGPSNTSEDQRLMALILRKAVEREDLILRSDGAEKFSFCYVTDAASAILQILLSGKPGEAYNIADRKSFSSLKEIVSILSEHAKVSAFFGNDSGSAVSKNVVVDSTKLEKIGWEANTSIHEGIKKQYESALFVRTLK